MKYVYQLQATGSLQMLDGSHTVRSNTVFKTKKAAESRIEKIKQIVTDTNKSPFNALNPEGLKIEILKLEIID